MAADNDMRASAAQRALATEVTALVHGTAERDAAEAAGRALFGQGDLADLPAATLSAALVEAPNVVIAPEEVVDGLLPAYDELFARSGLVASKSAARRTIEEGGAYVNNVRVQDPTGQPATRDLHHGTWLVLRRGKKAFAGVRIGSA